MFKPMYKMDIWQNDDSKVCLVNKIVDPNNKMSNLFFKLMGHPHLMALEHAATIVANAN